MKRGVFLAIFLTLFTLRPPLSPLVVHAQETILFSEPFDTFNNCNYTFGNHRAFDAGSTAPDWGPGNEWDCDHLTDGGDQGVGDGAAHIVMHPGVEQYNLGWDKVTGGTWSSGDAVYISWKNRWDDTARIPSGGVEVDLGGKNKLIIFGSCSSPCVEGPYQSRMIMYIDAPTNGGGGCQLGGKDYVNGPDPNDVGGGVFNTYTVPSYFGVAGGDNAFFTTYQGTYWAMFPQIGIDGEDSCGKPALLTYGNFSSPPAPGPNSSAPVNGWYKFIVKITSGAPGTARFTTWVNNCTEGSPTGDVLVAGIGHEGWGSYANNFGGYIDQEPGIDLGVRWDDLQISRGAFPSAWCGGSSPPSNTFGRRGRRLADAKPFGPDYSRLAPICWKDESRCPVEAENIQVERTQ